MVRQHIFSYFFFFLLQRVLPESLKGQGVKKKHHHELNIFNQCHHGVREIRIQDQDTNEIYDRLRPYRIYGDRYIS